MVKEKKYGVLVVGDNWGEELTNTNAILCEQKKEDSYQGIMK